MTEKERERTQKWLHNARLNAPFVGRDASELAGVLPRKETAVIFAAGASLKRFEHEMPKIARRCLTIASPTTLHWFGEFAGMEPDVVVNIDSHELLPAMVADSGLSSQVPVVLVPAVSPDWRILPNPFYWFLNIMHDAEGNFENHPYTYAMQGMFPDITTHVAQMGAVTVEAIWLIYLLQGTLGIKNIVLAGTDFSYWHNIARLHDPDTGQFYPTVDDYLSRHPEPDTLNWRGYRTNKRMLTYAWQLAKVQQMGKIRLWNMSDGPANTYLPRISARKVCNGQFPKYWSDARVESKTQRFLSEFERIVEKPR